MKYLIDNVWFWRARLVVNSLVVDGKSVEIDISNLGRASTSNVTLNYISEDGEVWMPRVDRPDGISCQGDDLGFNYSIPGCGFGVNATNSTNVILNFGNAPISSGNGDFILVYQKRVIDSSTWVSEPVNETSIEFMSTDKRALSSPTVILSMVSILFAAFKGREDTK